MFNWNYGAYKCAYNAVEKITDEEIKRIVEDASNLFDENMNIVLDILGGSDE